MILNRLPWRPRARPSATLHEIPICPMKGKLGNKYYYRPSGLSSAFHTEAGPRVLNCHITLGIAEGCRMAAVLWRQEMTTEEETWAVV